jgi:phosphoserine aminotransferase
MSKKMKLHNFNSGPSILPPSVLEKAAAAILDFEGSGLSILEIGHRTTLFQQVMDEAVQSVKSLMQIGDDYEVLFLHGGATTQFMQVPMNLLDTHETAAYCDNGIWGNKAIKEAAHFGNVQVVTDSTGNKHTRIDKDFEVDPAAKYLHFTTNNTVEGTQWHNLPNTSVPLVADMSSDIFYAPRNFNQFSLIYAGAQKNMGAAGVNMVVVKKEILGKISRKIPTIMDYQKHIAAGSLMNTTKSNLLYQTIDSLPVFEARVAIEDRSLMNAVFFLKDQSLEESFLSLCKQEGMIGVKGYRTVGGVRVSMYNAMPLSSVETFCELMKHFASKHG